MCNNSNNINNNNNINDSNDDKNMMLEKINENFPAFVASLYVGRVVKILEIILKNMIMSTFCVMALSRKS